MRIFSNLINRLHRVFNKSPQLIPVITVTGTTDDIITVCETGIVIVAPQATNTITFSSSTTLSQLVTAINLIPNVTATLTDASCAGRLAIGLYPDTLQGTGSLQYPTSILWCEMMAYALLLQEQADRLVALAKELYGHTADGTWSDFWWWSYFGIKRYVAESDPAYYARAKYEILSIKVNNKALSKLIADAAGIKVDVIDLGAQQYFMTNDPASRTNITNKKLFSNAAEFAKSNAFGVYIHTTNINDLTDIAKATIKKTCDRYRAAGTAAFYFAPLAYLDTNIVGEHTNSRGYVLGPDTGQWAPVAL